MTTTMEVKSKYVAVLGKLTSNESEILKVRRNVFRKVRNTLIRDDQIDCPQILSSLNEVI